MGCCLLQVSVCSRPGCPRKFKKEEERKSEDPEKTSTAQEKESAAPEEKITMMQHEKKSATPAETITMMQHVVSYTSDLGAEVPFGL